MLPLSAADVAAEITYQGRLRGELPEFSIGTAAAGQRHMNPIAEELKRRTFRFALAIVRFCRVLRTSWEGQELSDQLFRSGTRTGATYRAACRARSHDDFVSKIGIVVEEADETVYWLELIADAGLVPAGKVSPLLDEANQLSRIFNQSQLTAKDNPAWRHRRPRPLQGEAPK